MTEKRGLTKMQVGRLLQAIDPRHVDKKQGKLAYMAQHEVRAELTRIFGYGNWDAQTEEMSFLWESSIQKDGKEYWRACYYARVRVNIRDYWGNPVASFIGAHAEANSILPDRGEAHAMAVSSVESYAMRRAVISLGDRFGLGLYDGGSSAGLVKGTLQTVDPESPLYIDPKEAEAEKAEAAKRESERMARMQAAVNVKDDGNAAG